MRFGGSCLPAAAKHSLPGPTFASLQRVANKAPIAVRLAGSLIDRGMSMPLEDARQLELGHLVEIFSTRDAYAGLKSVGQTAPRFEGR